MQKFINSLYLFKDKFLNFIRNFKDKLKNVFLNSKKFIKKEFNRLKRIDFQQKFFKDFREKRIYKYLNKTLPCVKENLSFHWQPTFLIILKTVIVLIIAYNIYILYPKAGNLFEKGFKFFELSKIFNFDFPDKSFFQKSAKILFVAVIGYH